MVLLLNSCKGSPNGEVRYLSGQSVAARDWYAFQPAALSKHPTHFLLSTSTTAVGSASVTVNLTKGCTSVPTLN